MKTFIQSIPVFLPCKDCQDHAFEYIKNTNLDKVVQSRDSLFVFFFDFHNAVNKRLNKPQFLLSDALKKYGMKKPSFNFNLWLSIILISIAVLFLVNRPLSS
ncbi:hypothetical protein DH26_gp029 [Chloriridovirus anopheles1]|uniref:Sulfhydryl oxidase n=1 Tax=Chloriridovirus anopheles1 TaxID=1465751 RepID=W8R9K4_9VIRU|nr:hypothetical protein DH26_gp029 [Anopheles minimus iridovirus]AHL67526.1 hypothetical protein AMIV_029 [Anopheles minimus iridovirus]